MNTLQILKDHRNPAYTTGEGRCIGLCSCGTKFDVGTEGLINAHLSHVATILDAQERTVWLLEVKDESPTLHLTFEALKTYSTELDLDYFGHKLQWKEFGSDWNAAYHEHAHTTEYMYARKVRVMA